MVRRPVRRTSVMPHFLQGAACAPQGSGTAGAASVAAADAARVAAHAAEAAASTALAALDSMGTPLPWGTFTMLLLGKRSFPTNGLHCDCMWLCCIHVLSTSTIEFEARMGKPCQLPRAPNAKSVLDRAGVADEQLKAVGPSAQYTQHCI